MGVIGNVEILEFFFPAQDLLLFSYILNLSWKSDIFDDFDRRKWLKLRSSL